MEENKNIKPKSENKLDSKEKERLAREKEKQKEKERLAREKEKQKEKERLAREKEKQNATQKKPVVLTPKKGVEAKVLVGRSVPEEKQIVTLSDEVDEKELEKIKETESKDSLNKMQAIMEARQKLNSGILEKSPSKEGKLKLGKITLDDDETEIESKELQALKNRSNAQKALESELSSKKNDNLKAKLREASAQFGGLEALEEPQREEKPAPKLNDQKAEMLQAQIDDLEETVEVLNEALDNAENLEFEGVRVCDPETFELSEEFIEYINSLRIKQQDTSGILETHKKELDSLKLQHEQIVLEKDNEYKTKVNELEERLKELQKAQVETTNSSALHIENMQNQIKELSSELEETKNIKIETEKSLKNSLSSKEKELVCSEEGKKELSKENEKLRSQVNLMSEKHNVQEEKLASLNSLVDELTIKLESKSLLEENEAKLVKEKENLLTQIQALTKESTNNQEKVVELTNQVNDLEAKLSGVVSKEEAQAKVDEELKKWITKNNALTVEKANLNNKLEQTELSLAEINKAKTSLEEEKENLSLELVNAKKENMDLMLELTALKSEVSQKEEFVVTVEEVKENVEEAPAKKDVWKKIGSFFIDSFNGMAHGLFATLIIGVIICQIASVFKEGSIVNQSLNAIGTALKLLMGVGIGFGIARSLKLDGIRLIAVGISGGVCAYLQNPAGFGANADPLTIYIVVVLTYLVINYALFKKTPVDVIIVPLIAGLIAGVITLLVGDYVKMVTTGIGSIVNSATELNPLPYGIIIAVIMGMCLTAPISSAAIAISIGLNGLAAGAAVIGCCVQMVGFAIQSIRDNNVGKVVSVGIGTSMLQFKNILRRPMIWVPTIVASAILGPIGTTLFKLECSPTGAGMGTSGLVGVLQVFDVMGYTLPSILGVIVLLLIAPAILVFVFDLILRKLNLIKPGDLKI